MHIDFTLPQSCGKSKWLKPTDKKHQLHVAKKIAELHYGELHQHLPPVFQNKNRQILIHPHTNNHWLVLPGNDGLNKNQWRLSARYDDAQKIKNIITRLSVELEKLEN